jgi:hypothetical protein
VRVALGIFPHTGWAWVVRVVGTSTAARVEARARVVACDVIEGEVYHLAAERTGDQAGFLEERRQMALLQARHALEPHVRDVATAAVLGKAMALPAPARIVAAHPLIHGAEGEFWRATFAEACAHLGATVTRETPEAFRGVLLGRHGAPAIGSFLARARHDLGSPWSREPQDAALAAWSLLRPDPGRGARR